MNSKRHPVQRHLKSVPAEDANEDLEAAADRYANHARAQGTRVAYAIKMAQFKEFCDGRGEPIVPASSAVVAQYIAKMADDGMSPSTVNQFLSALGEVHELEGHQAPRFRPEVRRVWTGIKRAKGTRAVGMKPILADMLKQIVDATPPERLIDVRDRAIITFGWAGAFRRHEVADMEVEDLEFMEQGLRVVVTKSKEDQEGVGFEKLILPAEDPRYCPVRLVREWLDQSGIKSEAVFRPLHASGRIVQLSERVGLWPQYIEKVVKKMMKRAGIDPKGYGAHSLRAGFVTQAALLGKTEAEIMRHTGHATEHMVRRYIRVAELERFNATKGMGI